MPISSAVQAQIPSWLVVIEHGCKGKGYASTAPPARNYLNAWPIEAVLSMEAGLSELMDTRF